MQHSKILDPYLAITAQFLNQPTRLSGLMLVCARKISREQAELEQI